MTAADNTCEHGWTWGQCCPKPWPSADRTAFTHGLTPRPADEVVIDGKRWRVIPTGFGYDDGSQPCRLVPTEVAQDQVDWQTPCSHAIYHHGCPSCDRQDPEERER